jgi:hypothetical protein
MRVTFSYLCFVVISSANFHSFAFAQPDTAWQQVLPAYVDGVYYQNFFLGGNYYTRIALDDIDADGDKDLFYGGGSSGGPAYFENVGTAQTPRLVLRYERFPGLGPITSFGGAVDVDFGDLDADGDADAMLSADLDGGAGIFWNDGTPQAPVFVARPPGYYQEAQSNPTLVDIDADGDLDFFSGEGYRDMQLEFAENVGTPQQPDFRFRTWDYQNLNFGIPFNFDMADLDADADIDLLVCRHGGPVACYENTGMPDSAFFTLVSDDYLPDRDTTDWVESPELADIDADGDLDLFLAGAFAHLYFFENVGDSAAPAFVERYDTCYFYVFPGGGNGILGNTVDIDADGDDDLAPGPHLLLNQSGGGVIGFQRVDRALPFNLGSFCDLDADGDFDYICPGWEYVIKYFENIGGPSWPTWNPPENLFPADGRLGFAWSVTTGDLDGDGDYDLLAAHSGADLMSQYRNDGTPQSPAFAYAGRFTLPSFDFEGSFDMLLGDIDGDADLDLLIGEAGADESRRAKLFYYRNDGTPQIPSWAYVTDDFQEVTTAHRNHGVAPCLADIDADGDKDLVVTSNSLGLQAFLNPLDPVDAVDERAPIFPSQISLSAYPNPFNAATTISVAGAEESMIEIFDIAGRRVAALQAENGCAVWEAEGMSSGVYFARTSGHEVSSCIKIIRLK